MADAPETPADWTETEQWVWARITAGELADLNARDRVHNAEFKDLDPREKKGWTGQRRLRVKFLQTILTQKAFAEATPFGGVRILGALVDDDALDLEHARLRRLFWLERSRILVDIKGRNLRIDGEFSLEESFVAGDIELQGAGIRESLKINLGKFLGEVDLVFASIGSNLEMFGSTFEKRVSLNGTTVNGVAFLNGGATFKGEVDLVSASIGSSLVMSGSTFEEKVILSGATVKGAAFLRGGSTFKGEVDLVKASIGSNLEMDGSTFEGSVILNRATVNGSAFLSSDLAGGATFKGKVDIVGASIGQDLDLSDADISGLVDLTGCKVTGELRLGSAKHAATRWKDSASLVLRNTQVGALQDWWRNESDNSWPKALQLEGFTYDRLGGLLGEGKEANMMARPVASYIHWLARDPSASPQRYEQLARFFHQAGEPHKANDILYEARERRRRMTFSKVDDHDQAKSRDWREGLALWVLRLTVGYGLGRRYFRVLWWAGGFTLLGALLLITFGQYPPSSWLSLVFASLDQLLPIITLDKAHEALIFGGTSDNPNVPYWVRIYFYAHKIIGWVLGSFIVAGLAGLTQRN